MEIFSDPVSWMALKSFDNCNWGTALFVTLHMLCRSLHCLQNHLNLFSRFVVCYFCAWYVFSLVASVAVQRWFRGRDSDEIYTQGTSFHCQIYEKSSSPAAQRACRSLERVRSFGSINKPLSAQRFTGWLVFFCFFLFSPHSEALSFHLPRVFLPRTTWAILYIDEKERRAKANIEPMSKMTTKETNIFWSLHSTEQKIRPRRHWPERQLVSQEMRFWSIHTLCNLMNWIADNR